MKEIAIIGMGNMGSAIKELLEAKFNVTGFGRNDDLSGVQNADVAILAVKPQSFPELAAELWPHMHKQLTISIMAGLGIRRIANSLGTETVVRTMPNLALKVGQSLTAWYAKGECNTNTLHDILDIWGSSTRLESEDQFDAFTALAGSGPAYFFELAHALEQAALRQGFTAGQARQISLQTFRGAAAVLDSQTSAADWVKRVASKGGTTEAALGVFSQRGLTEMVDNAVERARQRSAELGSR